LGKANRTAVRKGIVQRLTITHKLIAFRVFVSAFVGPLNFHISEPQSTSKQRSATTVQLNCFHRVTGKERARVKNKAASTVNARQSTKSHMP